MPHPLRLAAPLLLSASFCGSKSEAEVTIHVDAVENVHSTSECLALCRDHTPLDPVEACEVRLAETDTGADTASGETYAITCRGYERVECY